MKILYANVIELNAGWGAEVFVNQALRAQGHPTFCVDYKKHRHDMSRQFLKVGDFDSFLLQRGDGISLRVLEAVQRPRFFWASELVSRCRDQDRLFEWGGFDFVWVRGFECRETLIGRGWTAPEKCGVLQSGFDPAFHRPPFQPVERDIDVLFVGSLTPRRQRILKKLSNRWNVHVEQTFGAPMIALLHRAKIVLNIHAEEFLDVETRIYEVLGCGAFLLSEPLARENPFPPEHIPIWENEAELNELIAHFLRHKTQRESICQSAHLEAWNHHTWAHRAAQIVSTMEHVEVTTPNTEALDRRALRREIPGEAWRSAPQLTLSALRRFPGLRFIKATLDQIRSSP